MAVYFEHNGGSVFQQGKCVRPFWGLHSISQLYEGRIGRNMRRFWGLRGQELGLYILQSNLTTILTLRTWLYFARRSDRHGAPVLICPVHRPTAISAM